MTHRTAPRIAAVGAALALTVPLAACGDDPETAATSTVTETVGSTQADESTSAAPDSSTRANDESGALSVPTDWRTAVETAKAEFDGEISEITLDREDGQYVYDIEVTAGSEQREIHVNAQSGDVVDGRDDDDNDDGAETFNPDDLVNPADAMRAALEQVPGQVTEWTLDHDDDHKAVVYQIDIQTNGDDHEVAVDAKSGEVVGTDD